MSFVFFPNLIQNFIDRSRGDRSWSRGPDPHRHQFDLRQGGRPGETTRTWGGLAPVDVIACLKSIVIFVVIYTRSQSYNRDLQR
jgi:hypothetical protein